MNTTERRAEFRKQVWECEGKAASARTEETRQVWLIAAHGWRAMADREELKYLDEPASSFSPGGTQTELETALRELASQTSRRVVP